MLPLNQCTATELARLIAGAAAGKDFADPIEVKAVAHLGTTGVDEWSVASARFPGDILAQLACGVAVNQENVVRIDGNEGSIFVPAPWIPAREGGLSKIIVTRKGEKAPREVIVEAPAPLYAIEADGSLTATGAPQLLHPFTGGPEGMEWSPDGRFLYVADHAAPGLFVLELRGGALAPAAVPRYRLPGRQIDVKLFARQVTP